SFTTVFGLRPNSRSNSWSFPSSDSGVSPIKGVNPTIALTNFGEPGGQSTGPVSQSEDLSSGPSESFSKALIAWSTVSRETVLQAMRALEKLSDGPLLKSSLWETGPVDCPPGSPKFVNAMVGLTPLIGETPESLLGKLQELEREFGRKPKTVVNE